MAKLNINGKTVTVDDSFLKLSPEEQNSTVDEIAKSLGSAPPLAAAPTAPVAASTQASSMPPVGAFDAMGNPTGIQDEPLPANTMPYGEQMAHVGRAADNTVRTIANGIPFMDRMAAGLRAAVGDGTYDDNLKQERAKDEENRKAAPGLTTAGNFAGSALLPIGALASAAKGATMLGKMGYGALGGASLGALQGASSTPDLTNVTDAAKDTARGAAVGGALGAALPPVAQGIGAGVRYVSNLLSPVSKEVSGPSTALLAEALRNDRNLGGDLTKLGPNAVLADAGPSMLALAQGVATKPGEGRNAIISALTERNAGTNNRVLSAAEDALGPASSPRTIQSSIKTERSAVHDDLPAVFENAPPVDVIPTLALVGQKLNKAVGPEASALNKVRDYLTETSQNGMPLPIRDAEKLSNAKIAIDKLIDYGDPAIGIVPGAISKQQGAIADVRKSLNDQLRSQVPGYADVMDRSSALARKSGAVEQGGDILGTGKDTLWPEDLRKIIAGAEPGQIEGLQAGTRSEVARLLGTKVNDLQALKTALQGDGGWNTQKLSDLFGPEKAQQLVNAVGNEAKFRDTFNKVVENSQTAPRAAANQAIEEATATKPPFIPKDATILGLLGNAGEWAAKKAATAATNASGDKARQELAKVLLMGPGTPRDNLLLSLGSRANNGEAAGQPTAALIGALLNYNARPQARSER